MKDLTKGNPFKLILLFALPVYGGTLIQQLYSMVDTIIVGKTVSVAALTGVGLTGSLSFFVVGFASGLTAGFGVRIAQTYGAGDEEGVRRSIAASIVLSLVIGVVMTVVSVPLAGPMLRVMNTHADYYDYACAYLTTICAGITATLFYNVIAAALRAVGDSRTPLLFLIAAAVINVGLDFLFLVAFRMHYIGAALATLASQVLSGAGCVVYMFARYPKLRLKKRDFRFGFRYAWGHLAMGLPMALQYSITAIGCIIQQAALNGLEEGTRGVSTAFATASKIDNFANQLFASLGTAMANFAGQNSGAGRFDRVRKGVRVSMLYALIGAAAGIAFCTGLAVPLMKLFVDGESAQLPYYEDIFVYGKRYLFFQGVLYLALGVVHVYRNALQGIGKSAVTMLSGVFELAGRTLTSFVFVRLFAFTGLCLSNPIAWLCADVFLLTTYYTVMYLRKKRERRANSEEEKLPNDAKTEAA